jgi:hypothetical protein
VGGQSTHPKCLSLLQVRRLFLTGSVPITGRGSTDPPKATPACWLHHIITSFRVNRVFLIRPIKDELFLGHGINSGPVSESFQSIRAKWPTNDLSSGDLILRECTESESFQFIHVWRIVP